MMFITLYQSVSPKRKMHEKYYITLQIRCKMGLYDLIKDGTKIRRQKIEKIRQIIDKNNQNFGVDGFTVIDEEWNEWADSLKKILTANEYYSLQNLLKNNMMKYQIQFALNFDDVYGKFTFNTFTQIVMDCMDIIEFTTVDDYIQMGYENAIQHWLKHEDYFRRTFCKFSMIELYNLLVNIFPENIGSIKLFDIIKRIVSASKLQPHADMDNELITLRVMDLLKIDNYITQKHFVDYYNYNSTKRLFYKAEKKLREECSLDDIQIKILYDLLMTSKTPVSHVSRYRTLHGKLHNVYII